MSSDRTRRLALAFQSWALVAIPGLLLAVGALHFRRPGDFFDFRLRYDEATPAETFARLLASGGRMPLWHDPHVLAYLGLPLIPAAALGLYNLGKAARPLAAGLALSVTLVGAVYLGGLFGVWTALFHGLGGLDPRDADGAKATLAALTLPRGALLLTTTLAKLGMVGLMLQVLTLAGTPAAPRWAPWLAAAGCALVVAFWDQDNWMMVGEALFLAGVWPLRRRLVALADGEASPAERARASGPPAASAAPRPA